MKKLFSCIYLIFLLSNFSFASEQPYPLDGVVNVPENKHVSLRKEKPLSTPHQYKLADLICYIGGRSEVSVLSEVKTYNNEVWYEVDIEKEWLRNPSRCGSQESLRGWMIGKTKNGYDSIKIKGDALENANPSTSGVTEFEAPVSAFQITWHKVLLMVLAVVMSVLYFQVERTGTLRFSKWPLPVVIVRFIVLFLSNYSVYALIESVVSAEGISMDGAFFSVIEAINQSSFGFFVLMLVFSLWLLHVSSSFRSQS